MNKKTVLYALLSVIVAIAYFLKTNKKEVSSNKLPAEISSTETKKDTAGLETRIVKDKYLPTSTTNQLVMHQNFTLSYHEKYEQAEWVFYEAKASGGRSSDFKRPFFIQDPLVKTGSADWKNYKNSGYDKGHLCPAGDMK
ncbi:MAG: endonuclease, partial [Flavobacterium johnsoniae]